MDNIWSWIMSLPSLADWPSAAAPSLLLASSPDKFILFEAECTTSSSSDATVAFSISLHEYNSSASRTLWLFNPSPLSSSSVLHSLLLHQIIHEITSLSPSISSLNSNIYFEQESISRLVENLEENEASSFFSLTLLLRLFWLCTIDAPAEAGYLFFSALAENVYRALSCTGVFSNFLLAVGPDVEQRYMRSLGYMLSKWCLLRDIQAGSMLNAEPVPAACLSYATTVHGLFVHKAYAPVLAMARLRASETNMDELVGEPKESALRYALAHQQLELVVQLDYNICMQDPRFIRVDIHVDSLRFHVVRLGYNRQDDETELEEQDEIEIESERHFPSRMRFWVGPVPGSTYATGPSLGRSSGNPEREVETTQTVKGGFMAGMKSKGIRAKVRSSTRTRNRSWRWEQEADGSAAVFEGVLCDTATWTEVATWRPGIAHTDPRTGLRRRWRGPGRAFSKKGGLVVAGDELPEGVTWRVGREMEGKKVRWRVGGRFWVSYFANEVRSGYWETRCVEWNHEVELALVAGGGSQIVNG
ncbi:neuronal PAS domain protein [Rhynchospora pubera]|uniref:Neuronal PAS domain protein n=1 Tax=Rhynchospora pubera TaxID=906938 RepID=A0AAV8D2I8_9POAL|nr:neuronal PAS domain protein [Rhynchospora pubera]